MQRLNKAQIKQKADLAKSIDTAQTPLIESINEYNNTVDQAYKDLEQAYANFNEVLTEKRGASPCASSHGDKPIRGFSRLVTIARLQPQWYNFSINTPRSLFRLPFRK